MSALRNSRATHSQSRLIAVATLIAALAFPPAHARDGFDGQALEKPVELPAFALLDHDGKPFGKGRFAGTWTIVVAGYTSCPDVCPYTLANVVAVAESFAAQAPALPPLQVMFLGVDPDRDRSVLREYVKHFGDDVVGVTGDVPELRKFVTGLGAFFRYGRKSAGADNYMVFHSAQVNVVDPQARVAARMNPPFDPKEAARFLAELVKTYKKGS